MGRPRKETSVEKEMKNLENQFDQYDQQIKNLTLDRMNEAPVREVEPQTKIAGKDIDKDNSNYLKPKKKIGSREKFNEKYREKYEFAKEYVNFIAENKEIIGESICIWTKNFAGVPAEYWEVPANKPVWGPRYLAEDIEKRSYHVLRMDQKEISSEDGMGKYYGQLVVDDIVPRLTARPVTTRRSVFMGA